MMQHTVFRAGTMLALAAALAGCSLAPTHERPAAPIAAQWPGAQTDGAGSAAATLAWQDFIADADLRRLVDLALANNRDLRQTLLNVEAARAQYRVQRADRLPGIEAQAGGTRQRVPADLNATLTALATALEGRGEQIGQNLETLDSYLKRINPQIPALLEDLK
ncbi:MAG: MCE family protein, partial [Bordetella sp.]|nr:MCE family protein [Bordetella sp.]